jgi:hypothetical protein
MLRSLAQQGVSEHPQRSFHTKTGAGKSPRTRFVFRAKSMKVESTCIVKFALTA